MAARPWASLPLFQASKPRLPATISPAHSPKSSKITQQVKQEYQRLKKEDASLRCLLKSAMWALASLFFPPCGMMSLADLFVLRRYFKTNRYLKDRAQFNITGDMDALNAQLPYRKKLSSAPSRQSLRQYDQLVRTILKTAEFYETDTFGNTFPTPAELSHNPFQHTSGRFGQKTSEPISEPMMKPLGDPSLKTLVAGQIAELLHQRPEYALAVLQPTDHAPLRFFISKGVPPGYVLGSYDHETHSIQLNSPCLHLVYNKCLMAQHEFSHALSYSGFSDRADELPMMSDQQKRRYHAARQSLEAMFQNQFGSPWGKLAFWLTGYNQTGIANHAFRNGAEFLAVSLDAFSRYPKQLCKTEPGRALYQIYSEIFGLDPLNDLK